MHKYVMYKYPVGNDQLYTITCLDSLHLEISHIPNSKSQLNLLNGKC